MKTKTLSFAIALLALFTFGNAYAQNPHFIKGPSTRIVGTQINITGKAGGLGQSQTYFVTFSGTATGSVSCHNGQQIVEAQSEPELSVQTTQPVPYTTTKGGAININFSVQTTVANNPCPNDKNWTPVIESISSVSGTLYVRDANGVIVLQSSLVN